MSKFDGAINNHTIFADTCLRASRPVRIAFMGDSRMRQVYQAFVRFVRTGLPPEEYGSQPIVHHYLSYTDVITKALVEYHWTPEPKDIASTFANDNGKRLRDFDVVIIGNGVRTIMETAKMRWFGFPMKMVDVDSAIESYKMQMQYLIPLLPRQYESSKRPLMVWMVQPRINETLLDADHKAAKNNVLDRINDIVQVMLKASCTRMTFWTNFRATAKSGGDGIHFDPNSLALSTKALQKCICTRDISGGPNAALTDLPRQGD